MESRARRKASETAINRGNGESRIDVTRRDRARGRCRLSKRSPCLHAEGGGVGAWLREKLGFDRGSGRRRSLDKGDRAGYARMYRNGNWNGPLACDSAENERRYTDTRRMPWPTSTGLNVVPAPCSARNKLRRGAREEQGWR